MADPNLSLKLLIDTKGKRVLFAETNKECIDFLFHILSLPVATIISLLKKQGMVGSIANLYESIENLNESYIQPNQTKETLLKPMPPICGYSAPLLLLNNAPTQKKFYKCTQVQCYSYVSEDPNAVCPQCCVRKMATSMSYHVATNTTPGKQACDEGGFVKGVVTYMVMDDMVVMPMSTISSITLLNKFNVKEVSALEEKVVNLGMDEAVKLLKSSLQSKRVLTNVFLEDGCELQVEETNAGSLG
ncbi:hypothetical protein BUALT_Bualt13G0069400 [Buddleja alternifolia]|uniref:DUF674 domain-containing protein n=1 Tax=Buddleja alternifolia TaxID=168488 RepID=A0AAV6WL43_9LAMI|nr:hypothetical protein BUALT_Bualt13G0069400 [Buddleja alternifolia]